MDQIIIVPESSARNFRRSAESIYARANTVEQGLKFGLVTQAQLDILANDGRFQEKYRQLLCVGVEESRKSKIRQNLSDVEIIALNQMF